MGFGVDPRGAGARAVALDLNALAGSHTSVGFGLAISTTNRSPNGGAGTTFPTEVHCTYLIGGAVLAGFACLFARASSCTGCFRSMTLGEAFVGVGLAISTTNGFIVQGAHARTTLVLCAGKAGLAFL